MGSTYTLIPRPIGCFAGLDMASRYAFGLIFDRWQLSKRDTSGKFKDQFGVYCVYSREAMAAEMGISLPTLRAAMKTLIQRELIHSRCPDPGCAWRYYVPPAVIAELKADRPPAPTRSGKTAEHMQRHTLEERRATYQAAVLDFDIEG